MLASTSKRPLERSNRLIFNVVSLPCSLSWDATQVLGMETEGVQLLAIVLGCYNRMQFDPTMMPLSQRLQRYDSGYIRPLGLVFIRAFDGSHSDLFDESRKWSNRRFC
jgi:hypothetical protein